ncbi:YraN family protein [Patescibacteria group bacterium]|nr:YraN family protein [Patescibacteria group bacterium]
MAKTQNFSKGRYGESLALRYLQQKGYRFIQSNFHTRYGEIDLIMIDKNKLIFIEVKYKSPSSPGTPEEMISSKKITQIQRTALSFLRQNPGLAKDYPSYRLDAVCIVGTIIKHYQNINL